MAFDTNGTKTTDLVIPEVLSDYVNAKLTDAIKFAPYADVDTTLVNRGGDTLSLPVYAYIGDATDVAEGTDITISKLTASKTDVKVKKAGKGVEISDEAMLSAYGDPIAEASDQMALSIGSKIDNDMVETLKTATLTHNCTGKLTADEIVSALVKFGEDLEGDKFLFVDAEQHADLLKEESWVKVTDMGVQTLMKGVVGMIAGCQVVISNKIKKSGSNKTNFIIKRGALGLLLKRDTVIEADRDIIAKATVLTADKHYATYLKDASKAIKITTTEA